VPGFFICRGEKTRTSGPYVPNVVRYQLRHTPINVNFRPPRPESRVLGTTNCATPRFNRRSLGAKAVFDHSIRLPAEKVVSISADKNNNFFNETARAQIQKGKYASLPRYVLLCFHDKYISNLPYRDFPAG
jgi:hypothetical protein